MLYREIVLGPVLSFFTRSRTETFGVRAGPSNISGAASPMDWFELFTESD